MCVVLNRLEAGYWTAVRAILQLQALQGRPGCCRPPPAVVLQSHHRPSSTRGTQFTPPPGLSCSRSCSISCSLSRSLHEMTFSSTGKAGQTVWVTTPDRDSLQQQLLQSAVFSQLLAEPPMLVLSWPESPLQQPEKFH